MDQVLTVTILINTIIHYVYLVQTHFHGSVQRSNWGKLFKLQEIAL